MAKYDSKNTTWLPRPFITENNLKQAINSLEEAVGKTGMLDKPVVYKAGSNTYYLDTDTANSDLLGNDGGNDVIYGNGGNDVISGLKGNDYIDGGVGSDFVFGDEGNDTLIGGTGIDYLRGSVGFDTYKFSSGDGRDYVWDEDEVFKSTREIDYKSKRGMILIDNQVTLGGTRAGTTNNYIDNNNPSVTYTWNGYNNSTLTIKYGVSDSINFGNFCNLKSTAG